MGIFKLWLWALTKCSVTATTSLVTIIGVTGIFTGYFAQVLDFLKVISLGDGAQW